MLALTSLCDIARCVKRYACIFAATTFASKLRTNRQIYSFCAVSLALLFSYGAQSKTTKEQKERFKFLVEDVTSNFSDVAASHGARIEIVYHWDSSGAGAFTFQKRGGTLWEIWVYDGIMNLDYVTEDVIQLVICHELGHHLSGYPVKNIARWSAAEGQADFFATHACAPVIWKDHAARNASFRNLVPEKFKLECARQFPEQKRRDICFRSVVAMESMMAYESGGKNHKLSLDTPDRNRVETTYLKHPEDQCRIDSGLRGILCNKTVDLTFIPGRFGQNSAEDERSSNPYYCNRADGDRFARPRCWFAPMTP